MLDRGRCIEHRQSRISFKRRVFQIAHRQVTIDNRQSTIASPRLLNSIRISLGGGTVVQLGIKLTRSSQIHRPLQFLYQTNTFQLFILLHLC